MTGFVSLLGLSPDALPAEKNKNSPTDITATLALLEAENAALRAEVERLRLECLPTDRKQYMRDYMRRKRAEAKSSNAHPERH